MLRLIVVFVIAVMLKVTTSEEEDGELQLLNRAQPPKGKEEAVEELKDMLVVSMQNIVSLNDLVTQLTQKIVQIMLSVGESKTEIELLKKSHLETVAKLRSQIASMEIGQNSTMTALANEVRAVSENVSSIDADVQGVREDISLISREVTIVSAEEGLRDARCAKVCAGTTGKTTTNWVDFGSNGIKTDADMSGCGFVSIPTVTTSLDGRTNHWDTTGSSEVYDVTTTSFRIYIYAGNAAKRGRAAEWAWNVEWVAVGYTC